MPESDGNLQSNLLQISVPCVFLRSLDVSRSTTSRHISGVSLVKLRNATKSSFLKSTMRLPYAPCSGLRIIQRRTHHRLSRRHFIQMRKICAYISVRFMLDWLSLSKSSLHSLSMAIELGRPSNIYRSRNLPKILCSHVFLFSKCGRDRCTRS